MIPVRPFERANAASLRPSTKSALSLGTFRELLTFNGGWDLPEFNWSGVPLGLVRVVTLLTVFFLPTSRPRALGAAQAVPLPITRVATTPTAMPVGVTRACLNQGRLNTVPPLVSRHRNARDTSSIRLS